MQIFAYLAAFILFSAASLFGFVAGAVFTKFPSTQRLGKSLLAGVKYSFPALIASQILALPIVILIILLAWGVSFAFQFNIFLSNLIGGALALCSLLFFAVASGYGIYLGYYIGNAISNGSNLKSALTSEKTANFILRTYSRLKKSA